MTKPPQFTCTIDLDGAAFEDAPRTELGRILREIADDYAEGRSYGLVSDDNGIRCGRWEVTP